MKIHMTMGEITKLAADNRRHIYETVSEELGVFVHLDVSYDSCETGGFHTVEVEMLVVEYDLLSGALHAMIIDTLGDHQEYLIECINQQTEYHY